MTGPTWQCSACDTFNADGAAVCAVCDTARGAGPARPARKPPAAGKASTGKASKASTGRASADTTAARAAAAKKAAAKKAAPRKAAAKKTPATAAKKAAPKKGTFTPLDGSVPPDLLAAGGYRVTPEMAALLPEVFRADGTARPEVLAGLFGADGRLKPEALEDVDFAELVAAALAVPPPDVPTRRAGAAKPAATTRSTGTPPRTVKGDAATGTPGAAREVTRSDEILGCGCLLVLVGAVVTGIVLLIMNWSTVWGFFTPGHHGSPSGKATAPASATPTATVPAGTPCPPELTRLYSGGEGSGLVAVYERADPHEEYAFCEDRSGTLHYFGRTVGKPFSGAPDPAKRIPGGFEVTYPATETFDFHDGVLTAYENGKKKWDDELTSKSSL